MPVPANSRSVTIVTPAPPNTRHGNRHTAVRWARHLRALGHRVRIVTSWDGRACDIMIALHARRSHASMLAWKTAHPARPLVLLLTGTDLYRDIRIDARAQASLRLADRLVVLQREGLSELPPALRRKAVVIHQSVDPIQRRPQPPGELLATVIGHLREEKDPFLPVTAMSMLDRDAKIRIVHLGRALSASAGRTAERWMTREPRYRWLGEVTHGRALQWLARSHLMIHPSVMEGGAHVVSEAIAAGVPVLASRIPGNVGLLGRRYPGYFPVGDADALTRLLQRAARDDRWLARLAAGVKAQRRLVAPAAEKRALGTLIRSLM